jgi:hypothetical protein
LVRYTRYATSICIIFLIDLKNGVDRQNQELIAIRLDPELLAAIDAKRALKRQSRSEFIRLAIYEAVKDIVTSKDIAYPRDRVGTSKGGRPPKAKASPAPLVAVPGEGGKKSARA